ncbi:MAG: PorT family protein [Microscillaceae bacterium]|nr:PorT family protein [Microscillaceae bacterium]MDW8459739.1 outer membrane beta-barrel protein [Cytophagales bacterium]
MKKFIFAFVVISTFAIQVVAQSDSKFRFGFRLAPIFTFGRVTDGDNNSISGLSTSSRMGLNFGLMGTYSFNDKLGIYSGAQIVLKGFKSKFTNINAETVTSVSAVEIPLALHMRSNEIAPNLKIRGLFGLSANIIAGARTKTTINGNTVTRNSTEGFNLFVPDFLVGAGVEWVLPNVGTLDLGLSYHHGLANLNRTKDQNGNITSKSRLSYLAIDLGYFF